MSSKRKGFSRKSASKVRKHAIQRLRMYIGPQVRGYSDKIGRKILLALQRAGRRECMPSFPVSAENIKKGGGKEAWFHRFIKRNDLYVVFGGDWSVMNIFQEDKKG